MLEVPGSERRRASHGASWTELRDGAIDGDEAAWNALCERLRRVVWRVVNGFTFDRHDAHEAYAATFFKLAERLGQVRDPDFLPGWIATTAHNESVKIAKLRQRTVLVADFTVGNVATSLTVAPGSTDGLIASQNVTAVRAGLAEISERCQQLLRLVTADPPLGYDTISEMLDIPRGSIGPTRARCLDALRSTAAIQALVDGGDS